MKPFLSWGSHGKIGVPWISQPVIFKFGTEYDNPTIYWLVVSALCLGKLPSFLGHPHDTQWDSQLIDDRNHQLMTNWKSDSHGYPESHDTSFFVSTYQLLQWRLKSVPSLPRAQGRGHRGHTARGKQQAMDAQRDDGQRSNQNGDVGVSWNRNTSRFKTMVSILKGSSLMTWMIFGYPILGNFHGCLMQRHWDLVGIKPGSGSMVPWGSHISW